ncbi:MAG: c-type cytochrome [Alphaproteobacteria bacterium]|nr:c-type cytochrome [Alphaproteobacteria bacterium]
MRTLLFGLVLASCSSPVDGLHASGSSTVAVGAHERVYNVNVDAGTVSRLDPRTSDVVEVAVGVEPSRLAVSGDALYVTLRGERAVARLDPRRFEEGVQARVTLGAEPLGIVTSPRGDRVYVALSQEDAVVELDADLVPIRRFSVPGEPRTLAIHPDGSRLYVGCGRGTAGIWNLDLVDGEASRMMLPQTSRSELDGSRVRPLEARVTGDPWVTSDGTRLLVPVLYVDTQTPAMALASVEEIPVLPEVPVQPQEPPAAEGYGGVAAGGIINPVDRMTPAVVEIPLSVVGEQAEGARALWASMMAGEVSEPTLVGSYISSVSASPSGDAYLATMEASGAAILIVPDESTRTVYVSDDVGRSFQLGSEFLERLGFDTPVFTAILGGQGLNGAVWLGDRRAFAVAAFDDAVLELDIEGARALQAPWITEGVTDPHFVGAKRDWSVSESPLTADVQAGRALFYSAREASMGGTGVSCSTCHFDGRNDGMTFMFDDGPRQTPSLAGRVSETTPVTWRSSVLTVADEAEITILGRLGGRVEPGDLASIAAYVDWTRLPDPPATDAAAVARGEAVFEAAGCGGCHSGDRYTDRQSHAIRGVMLDTPSLSGIAATAPYLHDGSAPTLRDVLQLGLDGQMGFTAGLTVTELDDLEAFLRSL